MFNNIENITPYSILKINEPSVFVDVSAIEKTYKTEQLRCHPDRFLNNSPEEQKQAAQYSSKLNEAFKLLRNEKNRLMVLWSLINGKNGFEMLELPTTTDTNFLMRIMMHHETGESLDKEKEDLFHKADQAFKEQDTDSFLIHASKALYLIK